MQSIGFFRGSSPTDSFVLSKQVVLVGREDCDVNIASRELNAQHAMIEVAVDAVNDNTNENGSRYQKERYTLRDLNTIHGTFINGERVPMNLVVPLKHGYVVQFGGQEGKSFIFEVNNRFGDSSFQGYGNRRFSPVVTTNLPNIHAAGLNGNLVTTTGHQLVHLKGDNGYSEEKLYQSNYQQQQQQQQQQYFSNDGTQIFHSPRLNKPGNIINESVKNEPAAIAKSRWNADSSSSDVDNFFLGEGVPMKYSQLQFSNENEAMLHCERNQQPGITRPVQRDMDPQTPVSTPVHQKTISSSTHQSPMSASTPLQQQLHQKFQSPSQRFFKRPQVYDLAWDDNSIRSALVFDLEEKITQLQLSLDMEKQERVLLNKTYSDEKQERVLLNKTYSDEKQQFQEKLEQAKRANDSLLSDLTKERQDHKEIQREYLTEKTEAQRAKTDYECRLSETEKKVSDFSKKVNEAEADTETVRSHLRSVVTVVLEVDPERGADDSGLNNNDDRATADWLHRWIFESDERCMNLTRMNMELKRINAEDADTTEQLKLQLHRLEEGAASAEMSFQSIKNQLDTAKNDVESAHANITETTAALRSEREENQSVKSLLDDARMELEDIKIDHKQNTELIEKINELSDALDISKAELDALRVEMQSQADLIASERRALAATEVFVQKSPENDNNDALNIGKQELNQRQFLEFYRLLSILLNVEVELDSDTPEDIITITLNDILSVLNEQLAHKNKAKCQLEEMTTKYCELLSSHMKALKKSSEIDMMAFLKNDDDFNNIEENTNESNVELTNTTCVLRDDNSSIVLLSSSSNPSSSSWSCRSSSSCFCTSDNNEELHYDDNSCASDSDCQQESKMSSDKKMGVRFNDMNSPSVDNNVKESDKSIALSDQVTSLNTRIVALEKSVETHMQSANDWKNLHSELRSLVVNCIGIDDNNIEDAVIRSKLAELYSDRKRNSGELCNNVPSFSEEEKSSLTKFCEQLAMTIRLDVCESSKMVGSGQMWPLKDQVIDRVKILMRERDDLLRRISESKSSTGKIDALLAHVEELELLLGEKDEHLRHLESRIKSLSANERQHVLDELCSRAESSPNEASIMLKERESEIAHLKALLVQAEMKWDTHDCATSLSRNEDNEGTGENDLPNVSYFGQPGSDEESEYAAELPKELERQEKKDINVDSMNDSWHDEKMSIDTHRELMHAIERELENERRRTQELSDLLERGRMDAAENRRELKSVQAAFSEFRIRIGTTVNLDAKSANRTGFEEEVCLRVQELLTVIDQHEKRALKLKTKYSNTGLRSKAELAEVTKDLAVFKKKVAVYEAEVGKLEMIGDTCTHNPVVDLRNERDRLRKKLADAEKTMKSLRRRIKSEITSSASSTSITSNKDVDNPPNDIEAERVSWKQIHNKDQMCIAALRRELHSLKPEIKKFNYEGSQIQQLQSELSDLRESHKAYESDKKTLVSSLKKEIKHKGALLNDLQSNVDVTLTTISHDRSMLEKMHTALVSWKRKYVRFCLRICDVISLDAQQTSLLPIDDLVITRIEQIVSTSDITAKLNFDNCALSNADVDLKIRQLDDSDDIALSEFESYKVAAAGARDTASLSDSNNIQRSYKTNPGDNHEKRIGERRHRQFKSKK